MAEESSFDESFRAVTAYDPFPWQRDLYRRLAEGYPTKSCNIPTGLGKTAIIPIWLIALAAHPANVPRRLVYVVNRRTVVDQATDEAMKLRKRLVAAEAKTIHERLRRLCAKPDGVPLAISTLRGQFADNREWSADPSRPAIILGTVDMIGSRLLFGGYGIGFKSKPFHAGFLGQDVLLVHDEAHLEPAFQRLLIAIETEQERCKEFRRFHVMELSATARGRDNVSALSAASRGDEPIGLTEMDLAEPEIKRRIEARKSVHLHEIEDEKKLPERLAELALQHKVSNRAVLVFARTVEAVEKVAEKLGKALGNLNDRIETLTGTIRGKERDDLVNKPVFRRFLPKADLGEGTVYLICTSAGEVGVNISADDLVCDLSTFESMAQRFGRVNRFGARDDTRIDVVHPKEFGVKEHESRLKKTLDLLGKLNGDGSPAALDQLDPGDRRAAFSVEPTILQVSDILFDAWALTTIRGKLPGRPMVEPYLHGVSAQDSPETQVAWREEVGRITGSLRERYKPKDLLEDYPIKPHELLRDRSNRVFDRLASLAKRHPKEPVWLLDDDGTVEILTLDEVTDKDRKGRINFCSVLLPPKVGGLKNGLLTGNPDDAADDVADDWLDEDRQQRRKRVWNDDEPPDRIMRLIRIIDTEPDAEDDEVSEGEVPSERVWYWYVRPRSADDDGSKTSHGAVAWSIHTNDVTKNAQEIVEALPLPDEVKKAVVLAAKYHDSGKKRIVWQRGIGNPIPTDWLAKSGRHYRFGKMKPIELTDYRHEFGSLLDVLDQPEYQELNDDQKDLVLHLIAGHHGFGRPHFPSDIAFDPEPKGKDVGSITAEVPRRFAKLQREYGRWGLAYLESLLRAADYAASASPSETLEKQP